MNFGAFCRHNRKFLFQEKPPFMRCFFLSFRIRRCDAEEGLGGGAVSGDDLIDCAIVLQFDEGAVEHFLELRFVDLDAVGGWEELKRLVLRTAKFIRIGFHIFFDKGWFVKHDIRFARCDVFEDVRDLPQLWN